MAHKGILGEFDLIADLLAPLAENTTANKLCDDAAVFTPSAGNDIVISTDTLVAGVHFPIDADAVLVAQRLVACNVSDLAAKGAKPIGCLLNLGVAPHWDSKFLRNFVSAFGALLEGFNMSLWGGDTVTTPTPFVSLTVHGLVETGQMLTRSGAQDGDDVYVTGTIGDGWLDLQTLGPAYAAPNPPLAFGRSLVGLAHASLDISDGLIADLDHICRASGGQINIHSEAIPLSENGRDYLANGGALADLITGGDDLQIAFTAPVSIADTLFDVARETQTALTRIGRFAKSTDERCVFVTTELGRQMVIGRRGYSHF